MAVVENQPGTVDPGPGFLGEGGADRACIVAGHVDRSDHRPRVAGIERKKPRDMRLGNRPPGFGKGGATIKQIGRAAREELSEMLEQTVHLILFVKVDPKWMDRREAYTAFGLEFDV